MIEVFGHVDQRESLERRLPIVTLLRGPASVGKWTLATYLTQYHGCAAVDVRFYDGTYPDSDRTGINMEAARDVVAFATRAPFGQFKCAVLNLDGASNQVLTTLLKLLEEPPRYMRFILVASRAVLDTVVSRSTVVNLGLLSDNEVYAVLTGRLQMKPELANRAAALSRGQVVPAMQAAEVDLSKAAVLRILKALSDRDGAQLEQVLIARNADDDGPLWTEAEQDLLKVWAVEASTGRWRVFTELESFRLSGTVVPRQVLWALSRDLRPRLSLRVGLASLVQ